MNSTKNLHKIIRNSYLTALKSSKSDKISILSTSLTKKISYPQSN